MRPLIEKRKTGVSVILIIILGFFIYSNSINGVFIWDDEHLVKNNLYIRGFSRIGNLLTGNMYSDNAGPQRSFYRPVAMMTYMLDYSLWKLNAKGYHLTNILLHISVALAIFWLVNIFYGNWLISLSTGVLYLVHPIHTEVVSYISGRSDSLAVLFMLLCFIFFAKAINANDKAKFLLLSISSYIVAILSRETSLILPALLLLYCFTFEKKPKLKELSFYFGITFLYVILRLTILRGLLTNVAVPTTFLQRLPGFFAAISNYARLLFLPFGLHMEYGLRLFNLTDPEVIMGILILSFILICITKRRKAKDLVFFSVSWFFISLLPVSNLYPPINAYMAEHWLYFPSIGFFLILASGLNFLYARRKLRLAVASSIVALVIFYSYLTFRQNDYWRSPIVFYERTLRYTHDSSRLYVNLGVIYKETGRVKEAVALYKKAIEINPNDALAYQNLGNTL